MPGPRAAARLTPCLRRNVPHHLGSRPSGFVIDRAAFEKINAVEGIRHTKASRTRATDFDRRGLSVEERRREIMSAHRPKG